MLNWFPALGGGDTGSFFTRLDHLTLPAIALGLSSMALASRITRSAVISELERPHVTGARARGFSEPRVVTKHAVRGALVPVVTIVGAQVGYLLGGAVVIEYAFGLNGLGTLLVSSVEDKNYAVVQAIALFITAEFLLISLVVDLLYGLIDPRRAPRREDSVSAVASEMLAFEHETCRGRAGGRWKGLFQKRVVTVSAVILFVIVCCAVFAPWVAPHNPNTIHLLDPYVGPSRSFPFGQDSAGRDILSRLIYGARLSLLGPTIVVAIALVGGVPLGFLAAYRGGFTDGIVSRLFDVIFAFPPLLLAVVIVATFGASFMTAVLAVAVTYIPLMGRLVRSAAWWSGPSPTWRSVDCRATARGGCSSFI